MLEAALRFLEARQRSTAEVRRRLLSAGYGEDLVEGAVNRLVDLSVLDDEAFARAWVESRDRAHPRGQRALQQELSVRGVDRTTIARILGERDAAALSDGDAAPDADAARRLMERHARALARVADPRARRQRAYALLARHGFDPETCRSVAAALAGDGDQGPEALGSGEA